MSNRIPDSDYILRCIRQALREGWTDTVLDDIEGSHKAWRRWGKEVSRKERLDLEAR